MSVEHREICVFLMNLFVISLVFLVVEHTVESRN
jgi:hypothetical protein